MEAIVALMARLPAHELGYELGRIRLNVRRGATPELVALGARESRVPDIEVCGTHVGFNYDGGDHLDLDSIARAALGGTPIAPFATSGRSTWTTSSATGSSPPWDASCCR